MKEYDIEAMCDESQLYKQYLREKIKDLCTSICGGMLLKQYSLFIVCSMSIAGFLSE